MSGTVAWRRAISIPEVQAVTAQSISPGQAQELMRSSALFALIDVREWGEFALEQILGSRNISRGSLEKYLPFLVPDRGASIMLVCSDGGCAMLAAPTVDALGYKNVSVLEGGLIQWKRGGGETYGGWSLTGKDYGERLLVQAAVPEISADTLHRMLAAGGEVCILDSRPRSEYRASHLPGALSAPLSHIAVIVKALDLSSTVPIVTNCAGRTRSIIAAHLLSRMNLPNPVYALKGGTGAWRIAGWESELSTGDDSAPAPAAPWEEAAEFAARLRGEDSLALISPEHLQHAIRTDRVPYILDVRSDREYVAGHIPGARYCSATQIQFAVDTLVGVQNAPVVIVCDGSVRATIAGSILRGMGYPDVSVLDGGFPAWAARGYDEETGAPFEIDYGEPAWLARFLQDYSASAGMPRKLSTPGVEQARERAAFVTAKSLQAELQTSRPPVVIDLRGAGEFATAHIAGAHWMPRGWLELKIDKIAPRDSRVVLYSRGDTRAVLAAAKMAELGYRDTAVLEGGFAAWKRNEGDVEDGLGAQTELEEIAAAEIGLFGRGKFGYSNERMARYLRDEEALGRRYRKPAASHR
jgi:rhodanese-related sulfurtransferase